MRVKRPSEKLLRVRSCSSHSDVCTSGHLVGKGLPRAEKGEATVRDTSKRSSQLRRRRFSCAPCGPLPHAPGRESPDRAQLSGAALPQRGDNK